MLCILALFVCSTILLLLLLDFYVKNYTSYKIAKSLSCPSMLPIIGSTQYFFQPREKSFQMCVDLCNRYKNGFAFWCLGIFFYHIYSADSIEKILTNPKHIEKPPLYKFFHRILGDGLLISRGEKWFARRKLLSPSFHFNILNGFQLTFNEQTKILVNEIRENEVNRPEGTDLQKLLSLHTLHNICESAMGVKSFRIDELDDYRSQIHAVGQLQLRRLHKPWWHIDWLYFTFGNGGIEKKIASQVRSFTRKIIAAKRKSFEMDRNRKTTEVESVLNSDEIGYNKKRRLAMLDTLLIAEQNGQIDSAGIQEEVDTFIAAGFDTTMTAITFTLFAIANHDDVQKQLYEEIASMEETQSYSTLKYLDAVIKESLRIFPPAPIMGRVLGEDTVINGVNLPTGTIILIQIHALHRDPTYFPDPDVFNPNRFLENRIQHPFAYIPFSAGQRNCIGQKFAIMEIRTAIAEIIKNFELKPITKPEDVYIISDLVYRSKDPIRVQFIPRTF